MSRSGKNSSTDGFGRDEMAALLGGDLPERLVRNTAANSKKGRSSASNNNNQRQLADMTTQETAAWLLSEQQQKKKTTVVAPQRHRTKKVRNYHQLLEEEQQLQPTREMKVDNTKKNANIPVDQSDDSPSSDSSVGRKHHQQKSQSLSSDESSSEEESDSSQKNHSARAHRPRHDSSSSSSEDDEAQDSRRQRLLQQRRKAEVKPVEQPTSSEMNSSVVGVGENTNGATDKEEKPIAASEVASNSLLKRQRDGGSSSDSSSSTENSESSDDSSEGSSSDDEEEVVRAKPLFVPRSKRGTVQTIEQLEMETQEQTEKELKAKAKRQQESRAKVQQVVSEATKTKTDVVAPFEGITGAKNEVPDDKDVENDANVKDEWEVRELVRLLHDMDVAQAKLEEEREIARRRKMTDEERMQEDADRNREKNHDQPGKDKRHGQRYFHKGAFYMDEDEWDESDVRHKAETYASAPTGEDLIDRSLLPKVMQVKKFGRANQNRNYKGLHDEDTTDRETRTLSIHKKTK